MEISGEFILCFLKKIYHFILVEKKCFVTLQRYEAKKNLCSLMFNGELLTFVGSHTQKHKHRTPT